MTDFENPNDALKALVVALGGTKQVGPALWPDKGVDEARRLLCDTLSDERPAKLDLSQVLFIFRLGKAKGVHIGMDYIAATLGYSKPTPLEPIDELADLLRQVSEQQKTMAAQFARIAALQPQLRGIA